MAHKKAGGSTRNGRDSEGRRLGLKKSGGQSVIAGNIIVPVKMLVWVKITLCLLKQMALWFSNVLSKIASMHA